MYVPRFNAMEDPDEIRAFVAAVGSAELVTVGADGYPRATLLPVVWHEDRVIVHFARANPHWREIDDDAPVLLVCRGPQAYVSPSWYATKAEHGRVVPTWNYSAVQIRGRIRIHDDAAWVREAVTLLTDQHEQHRAEPWQVRDAPERYVDKELKAIVGAEVLVETVAAKAKLSQNRSDADRAGVVTGLEAEGTPGATAVAEQMRERG